MATPVYVWPLELLGSAYADLHGGNTIGRGFEMMHATLDNDGIRGHKITLIFDFESPLAQNGRINLAISGASLLEGADAEAERSAVLAMVVRSQYHIFPGDYNLVVISQNRALFNAMGHALQSFRTTYDEIQNSLIQSNTAMIEVCQGLSCWIADDHPDLEPSESVAVSAFHAILSEQAIYVANDVAHARLLVDMLLHRDAEPDGQSCLDTTWPVPMTISWERSYYTLRTIYNEAIKKLGCVVSTIRVVKIGVGQFRASVDIFIAIQVLWGSCTYQGCCQGQAPIHGYKTCQYACGVSHL